MNLIEHGPLQKASEPFIDDGRDKWKFSTNVLIGILLLAISAGAIGYMIWDSYCKENSILIKQ